MTANLDTQALRALEAAATPAPWGKTPFEEKNDVCIWRPDGQWLANVGNWANCQLVVEGEDGPEVVSHPDLERIETGHDANAEFMVAIRNAAPALLDAAEERDRLKAKVEDQNDAMAEAWEAVGSRTCGRIYPNLALAVGAVKADRDALRSEVERLTRENEAMRRRHEWMLDQAAWLRHEHTAYVAVPVPLSADLSSKGSRADAIDRAFKNAEVQS